MTYLQAYRHVAMRALLVLALWSLLLCAALALASLASGPLGATELKALAALFGTSFVTGYLLLMAFGIPLYLWCARSARVVWPYVLLIGVTPGLVVLFIRTSLLGLLMLVSGGVVAMATHWWVMRDLAAQTRLSATNRALSPRCATPPES